MLHMPCRELSPEGPGYSGCNPDSLADDREVLCADNAAERGATVDRKLYHRKAFNAGVPRLARVRLGMWPFVGFQGICQRHRLQATEVYKLSSLPLSRSHEVSSCG